MASTVSQYGKLTTASSASTAPRSHSGRNNPVDFESPSSPFRRTANATMVWPAMTPSTSTAPRPRVVSDFDMSRIPVIHRRILHPWSVHRSLATGKYIATVARYTTTNVDLNYSPTLKLKHTQHPFPTDREARRFCKAFSPPKLVTGVVDGCQLCHVNPTSYSSSSAPRRHCRNCGAVICERCTQRWGVHMVPKTYVPQKMASTVRVCKSCHWLSNAFCMALLQARYQDALRLYETVRVWVFVSVLMLLLCCWYNSTFVVGFFVVV